MAPEFTVDSLRQMNVDRLTLDRGGQGVVQGSTGLWGKMVAFFKGTTVARQNRDVWNGLRNAIAGQYRDHGGDIADRVISRYDTGKPLSSRKAAQILEEVKTGLDRRNFLVRLWGNLPTKLAIQKVLGSDDPIILSKMSDSETTDILNKSLDFYSLQQEGMSDREITLLTNLGISPRDAFKDAEGGLSCRDIVKKYNKDGIETLANNILQKNRPRSEEKWDRATAYRLADKIRNGSDEECLQATLAYLKITDGGLRSIPQVFQTLTLRSRESFNAVLAGLKGKVQDTNVLGQGPRSCGDKVLTFIRGIELKMEAETPLRDEMKNHGAFSSFDKNQLWRLVIDKYQQENRGEYGFENESGYLHGMFNGLTKMLQSVRNKRRLDADLLNDLHDTCVDKVMNMGNTIGDAKYLAKGMRDSKHPGTSTPWTVGFSFKKGLNMTEAGLSEIKSKVRGGDDWFTVTDTELRASPKTKEECKARARSIINKYYKEIGTAKTEDEKYRIIAECCRDLEIAHLYPDGNLRAIGFLVVNKLLIENGLPPVIMENPNRFDGYSIPELVSELKQGAGNFKAHCTSV